MKALEERKQIGEGAILIDDNEARDKVALAMRILVQNGVTDNRGHVSLRAGDGQNIYILGRVHVFGRSGGDATAADVVTMDLDGKAKEGFYPPPSERFIHTELYRDRSEVGSVIHFHPFVATALSAAGQEVLPVSHTGVIFGGSVPIWDQLGHIDSKELGQLLARAMDGKKAILLRGHGAVTLGSSVEEACVLAVALEKAARMQLLASLVGKPEPLPIGDPAFNSLRAAQSSPGYFRSEWSFLQSKLKECGVMT